MADRKQEVEYIKIEISHLDYLLIRHVNLLRIDKGLSQVKLTQKMGLSEGFIGKVELFSERAKYNIRHLHLLAKALEVKLEELIPKEKPQHDMVILTLRRTNKINLDGSISPKKSTEVISIEPVIK